MQVRRGSVENQVRFNRIREKFPEEVPGSLRAKPPQLQRGSEEGCGKAEKVPMEVWEALVQSQVTFNRVPKKVPGDFGVETSQIQQGSLPGGFGAEAGQHSSASSQTANTPFTFGQ